MPRIEARASAPPSLPMPEGIMPGPIILSPFHPIPIPEVIERSQSVEKAPLRFIPPPGERAKLINTSFLPVSEHEGHHALLMYALGYAKSIHSISVEPKGNILGQVIISGFLPPQDFHTIAAGGAIPFNFSAFGYGSDLFKIQSRDGSISHAKARAKSKLDNYPKPVREKVTEMIAFLKVVPGSLFPGIVAQAYYEMAMEAAGKANEIKGKYVEYKLPDKLPEQYTTFIPTKKGDMYVVFINHAKDNQDFRCPICGLPIGARHKHLYRRNPYDTKKREAFPNKEVIFENGKTGDDSGTRVGSSLPTLSPPISHKIF